MRVVHLARKPLTGSVASNVLEHGTGALNIDATRLESGGEHLHEPVKGRSGGMNQGDERTDSQLGMFQPGRSFVPTNHPGGRWPANLILEHRPGCRVVGTHKVATGTAVQRHGGGQAIFGGLAGNKNTRGGQPDAGFAGADGKEEIPTWECESGCPVANMDYQGELVGVHGAGHAKPPGGWDSPGGWGFIGKGEFGNARYGDKGGASRFFKQVGGDK
jgi:hypothetical protein